MDPKKLSRRRFVAGCAAMATGILAAACAPKIVEVEKVVKETVVKEVEKVVKETVLVEGTPQVVEKVVKETVVVEKEVTAAPAKVEPVTIRHACRTGGEGEIHTERQVPFEANYPHIKIKQEQFPGGEYFTKLETMLASGTASDTWWISSEEGYYRYADRGLSLPLGDLIDATGFDLGAFYPKAIDCLDFRGELYGLPWCCHPGRCGCFYNKTLFEEAGVEPAPADGSWDVDDFLERAKALTRDTTGDGKTDQFAIQLYGNMYGFLKWMRGWGGEIMNKEGTKCLLAEPEAMAALTWLYELLHKHKVAPRPAEKITQMFQTGKVAMMQSGYWSSYGLKATIGDRFEMFLAPIPKGPAGVFGTMLNADPECITKGTKHPSEAFEWVKWMTNKETGIRQGEVGRVAGARPDVWNSPRLTKDHVHNVWKSIMEGPVMPYHCPANFAVWEMMDLCNQGIFGPIMAGEEAVEEIVPPVAQAVQKVLDEPAR